MRYAFRIVNVFTVDGDRLSGNPLCVFPDARGMSDAQMQALAKQMNLSETTFVLPDNGSSASRVRIFTPEFEMPFAGHPTLGTASVIGGDRVVLEMTAGSVPVTRDGTTWTLRAAKPPATRPFDGELDIGARVIGTPLYVDTGVEQLVVPVDDVRAAHGSPKLPMVYLWAP